MAPGPESRLDAPAGSSVPIQRGVGDGDVPESWLLEPDLREQAEHVDRLAADLGLLNDLALEGFVGRKWTKFETELAKYGMAVIGGWMRRWLIFGRCRDRGYSGLPEPGREFDEEEVEELTDETVGKALYHFREDLKPSVAQMAGPRHCRIWLFKDQAPGLRPAVRRVSSLRCGPRRSLASPCLSRPAQEEACRDRRAI